MKKWHHSYPLRLGFWRSPASRLCRAPSEQNSAKPTPPGWSSQPHPRRPPSPETTKICAGAWMWFMTLSDWAQVTGSSNKILWSPNIHPVTQLSHLLTLCPHSCPHRLVIQLAKNPPAKQETACNAGNLGLIPGSVRSPGERNGNPLQYSCLGNFMDRGTWQATVHGIARVRHD